jgi:hypothetical protein
MVIFHSYVSLPEGMRSPKIALMGKDVGSSTSRCHQLVYALRRDSYLNKASLVLVLRFSESQVRAMPNITPFRFITVHFTIDIHIYIYILYPGWWFQTCFIFYNIWDVIFPIDELVFFKMVIAPPTSSDLEPQIGILII